MIAFLKRWQFKWGSGWVRHWFQPGILCGQKDIFLL